MIQRFLEFPMPIGFPSMETIIFVTAVTIIASAIILIPISLVVASYIVYVIILKRTRRKKWSRDDYSNDPEHLEMRAKGLVWHKANESKMSEVHIKNNGLNLYGEYYDFGGSACVIILSGRSECLEYSYYFAIPYAEMGFNVLAIDPRAHGKSDGKYNTVGFEESGDALAWATFIHEKYSIDTIIFHGICIGAAGAMYAITSYDCPEYIKGMVAEGMFANFGESMKNHLIERKKPTFIIYDMINFWMKRSTGYTMDKGPIDVIDKMDKPLLMIHSREDIYSTPEFAQKLYDLCPSDNKELVWHEHGAHSMLRYTDTVRYDNAIESFIRNNFVINNNNLIQ